MARHCCLAIGFVLLAFGAGCVMRLGDPILGPGWYTTEDSVEFTQWGVCHRMNSSLVLSALGMLGVGIVGATVAIERAAWLAAARRRTRLVHRFGSGVDGLATAPAVFIVDSARADAVSHSASTPGVDLLVLHASLRERLGNLEAYERRADLNLLLLAIAALTIALLGASMELSDAFTSVYAAGSSSIAVIASDAVVALRFVVAGGTMGSGLFVLWVALRDDSRCLLAESRAVARNALATFANRSVRQ